MALAAVAALAGCGLVSTPTPDNQDGMGLPRQLDGETYPGPAVEVEGQVHVAEDGCVYLLGDGPQRIVIWPAGSTLSSPVRLPDGTELTDGDPVAGRGRVVRHDALPGGPDGYWAHVTGFCDAGAEAAFVLDEVSEVR